jgi:hypothetical protein
MHTYTHCTPSRCAPPWSPETSLLLLEYPDNKKPNLRKMNLPALKELKKGRGKQGRGEGRIKQK